MEVDPSLEGLVPKASHVLHDLEELTLADYQVAIDRYLEAITSLPGVRFVGQFGKVGTPGVSDLDLLVVTEDRDCKSISERSSQLVQEIPNGPYIFWHPAIVVPLSLVPAMGVLHTLDGLRLLWGDGDVLSLFSKPTYPLSAISTVIWNSYLWRIVLNLHSRRRGLRMLMLVLGNIIKSAAADYVLMGKADKSSDITRRGKDAREEVLKASVGERCGLVIGYLSEALQQWQEADWALQDWWVGTVKQGSKAVGVRLPKIHVSRRVTLEFSPERRNPEEESTNLLAFMGTLWRRLHMRTTITLPGLYLEVTGAVKSAVDSNENLARVEAGDRSLTLNVADGRWHEAIKAYVDSVEAFKGASCFEDDDEYKMLWAKAWALID